MLTQKSNLAVILTTFHHEMLSLSLRALQKLRHDFLLVIFNDNPDKKLSKLKIRKLGYTGRIVVFNSDVNNGPMFAKMSALDLLRGMKKVPEWTIFVDDDDFLANAEVPKVSEMNFAIMQNMLAVKSGMINLLKLMHNPEEYTVDNDSVIINKPSVLFTGTLIRTDILFGFANVMLTIKPELQELSNSYEYRLPVDNILWNWLNLYVKEKYKSLTPIYRDKVNYIANWIDLYSVKYGKQSAMAETSKPRYKRNINLAEGLFENALAAALRG